LERTETPVLWLPESLSVGIKRAVKLISNFHHVAMLRVSGDIPTILCVSSWSFVTNLQHQEHVIEGHRVLVY